MPQGNQQVMDSAQNESPFQQVIPNVSQQSLPFISSTRYQLKHSCIPTNTLVINDIDKQQRKALEDTVEGTIRLTNTPRTSEPDEQDQKVSIQSIKSQATLI